MSSSLASRIADRFEILSMQVGAWENTGKMSPSELELLSSVADNFAAAIDFIQSRRSLESHLGTVQTPRIELPSETFCLPQNGDIDQKIAKVREKLTHV